MKKMENSFVVSGFVGKDASEAWRKNENTTSFDRLVKGALLTVEGYFKPEEWQDADGVKRNRVAFVATRFYEAVEKEETPAAQEKNSKKGK